MEDNKENQEKEFDANAFLETAEAQENNSDNDQDDSAEESSEDVSDENEDDSSDSDEGRIDDEDFAEDALDLPDVLNSDDDEDEDSEGDDSEEDSKEIKSEEQEDDSNNQEDENEDDDSQEEKSFDFKSLGDELGVEINGADDLKSFIEKQKEEIKELQQLKVDTVSNKKIDGLQKYVELNDNELLLLDFKANGFNDEEAKNAIDTYKDNGTVKIEATKIRNNLKNAISRERKTILEQKAQTAKQNEQEVKAFRDELKKAIDNSETMFGFKIAKTKQDLPKVRESHYEYATKDFLNEITKDAGSVAEASWLWRNRDAILKAAKNRGKNESKQELIDSIQNPDTNRSSKPGVRDKDGGGFNARKFLSTN